MVLKLYVSANSPNARLVAVVLHEKKVPFEVIELDFDKDLKSPKYLKLQPFGQEPTIVHIILKKLISLDPEYYWNIERTAVGR